MASARPYQPAVCKHCVASKGETAKQEIAWQYRQKDGTRIFLCNDHSALVASLGIKLDQFNRNKVGTYRPMEGNSILSGIRGLVDNPANWTHGKKYPGQHRTLSRGNVIPWRKRS